MPHWLCYRPSAILKFEFILNIIKAQMTLRGSGADFVSDLNGVTDSVNITAGPGINVSTNYSTSSIQIATNTAAVTFDKALANGNQTTRTAKFASQITDIQPTVAISPSGLQFGQGGAVSPTVALTYSPGVPDGLAISSGKTLRSDIIGAVYQYLPSNQKAASR